MVIGFYSCILIQWESSVDANSELLLFKEIYDETLDKMQMKLDSAIQSVLS